MAELPANTLPAEYLVIKSRLDAIDKDIWIDCPQSRTALNGILCMLQAPRRVTAPCILVCGEPGSGKTAIKNQLEKRNSQIGFPCVFITITERLKPMKFAEVILEAIGLAPRLANNKNLLTDAVGIYLKTKGIRALVIDEFHEMLYASKNDQLKSLSLLKGLSGDPFNISVILLGTKAAHNALMGDPQLSRRYQVYELPSWRYDSEFRNFVATMERLLALQKPSGLDQSEMLRFIYDLSDGVMDNVVKILRGAAKYAITTGEERVTKELMGRAKKNLWGFGPVDPSE